MREIFIGFVYGRVLLHFRPGKHAFFANLQHGRSWRRVCCVGAGDQKDFRTGGINRTEKFEE